MLCMSMISIIQLTLLQGQSMEYPLNLCLTNHREEKKRVEGAKYFHVQM